MSDGSKRTRVVIGGLAAGGALAAFAPAGMAHAAGPKDHEVEADTPGAAVGRPSVGNPAPGLRAAQQFGDSIFNQTSTANKALDDSPAGAAYHQVFGQQGTLRYDEDDQVYYYDTTTGSNGAFTGVLNTTPGNIIGGVVPVKECNLVRNSSNLQIQVSVRAQCN
jgi:hypothetical protein